MSIFICLLPEPKSPNDWIDAAYIAERTGLSERTVKDGKAGLSELVPVSRKPMRWRLGDFDAWLEKQARKSQPKPQRLNLLRRRKAS